MRTGLCIDPRFRRHQPPGVHPERPERLEAIEAALHASGLADRCIKVEARPAARAELERVHSIGYLDGLEKAIGATARSGWLDADTYFSPGTWEAALLAAGATIDLAAQVATGALDNGMAFVRPPGHHATRERAMGFCLLNNIAIAAARLRADGMRVAIVDWDVHHGNGTEAVFDDDPEVLYASTHEWPQYPGTGPADYTGRGEGRGTTVNVPLPSGTDDAAYLAAFRECVLPAVAGFRPDVVLVSAGFDAHRDDPLGGLDLTEQAYTTVTRHLLEVQPRLAAVLEGGYDLGAIARSAVSVLGVLRGAI
jgi:acetoin utilization deacetylase AcuC-like enzyme